jgi:type III restriction enzyme
MTVFALLTLIVVESVFRVEFPAACGVICFVKVLNTPLLAAGFFIEPKRHFKFTEEGITNEIVEERRPSAYFIPIARPRSKGKQAQLSLDTEWTADRLKENDEINRIRARVDAWRKGGYVGVTKTTACLLEYWNNPVREKKLFFCQVEALETAIYLAEVAELLPRLHRSD